MATNPSKIAAMFNAYFASIFTFDDQSDQPKVSTYLSTFPTGLNRAVASSIIGGGEGLIFIYSCSAQLISFEID